jgi:hypothetical protein
VGGGHVPGQEVCDTVDGVFCDAGQDVSQVAFRVDAVEFGGAEQRVDGGGAFSAPIRSGEQIVFPSECDDAERPFGGARTRKADSLILGLSRDLLMHGRDLCQGGRQVEVSVSRRR